MDARVSEAENRSCWMEQNLYSNQYEWLNAIRKNVRTFFTNAQNK